MNNYNDEKLKIKLEKLAQEINQWEPQKKELYVINLKNEIRLLQAKLQDSEIQKDNLDKIPNKRKMSGDAVATYLTASTIVGFLAGVGVAVSIEEMVMMLLGAGAGFLLGIVNGIAWEEKPISNKVNNFRKYLNGKKTESLQDKIASKRYLQAQLGEIEL